MRIEVGPVEGRRVLDRGEGVVGHQRHERAVGDEKPGHSARGSLAIQEERDATHAGRPQQHLPHRQQHDTGQVAPDQAPQPEQGHDHQPVGDGVLGPGAERVRQDPGRVVH